MQKKLHQRSTCMRLVSNKE